MSWTLKFLPEAEKDMQKLDHSDRILVAKSIKKVLTNPVSSYDGGYGKPLGNKNNTSLSGFYKIKLKGVGLRIVYTLIKTETSMMVIVVGARADSEVYETAEKRIKKYGL